jgi:5-methylcytosine-specific restriction endonuclease McrA
MEQYRLCNHCQQVKALEVFCKNRTYATGYTKICRDCNRIRSAANRKKNPYAARRASLLWKLNNPEKHKALLKKHTKKKISAGKRRDYYGTERKLVRRKDLIKVLRNPCIYCGSTHRLSIEHVIPVSRGGRHAVGNIASACLSCNCSKRDQTVMEWRLKCLRASADLDKQTEKKGRK